MRHLALFLGLCALALARPARADKDDDATLQSVQRAMRELRYEDARDELEQALQLGHHGREQALALLALRSEVAAVLEGPAIAEAAFRKLLVLDPEHAPPSRSTPIMTLPFTAARRWVAEHGHLDAEVRQAAPRPSVPTSVSVALRSDPLALVAGVRLYYREDAGQPYSLAPASTLRQSLPALPPGAQLAYYFELVDAAGNVLLELGDRDEPLELELPASFDSGPPRGPAPRMSGALDSGPPRGPAPRASSADPAPPRLPLLEARPARAPARPRPLRTAGWVMSGLGLASLGAGIGIDVAGRAQFDRLLGSCAPQCSDASIAQLHQAEGAAIGLYAGAAAVLATSAILLIVDRVQH